MNRCILVFINGRAGVGKDTFFNFCKEYAEDEYLCRCYNIHRSDAPKVAMKSLGWDGVKDEESRSLLKHMVDFMEGKGLLDEYLHTQIKSAKSVNRDDVIVFYHVRDPEVMYDLIDEYLTTGEATPISLLVKRDIENNEPAEWWGNLEEGDYMMGLELENGLENSKEAAECFVDFLLNEKWTVVREDN